MTHTHDTPRNNLEAYERIVPLPYFHRVRDALAEYLDKVRSVHPKVNPVMVAMEYILQAKAIHTGAVYSALSSGRYGEAMKDAYHYFDHLTLERPGHDTDRAMARLEFDAMRRWAVPGAREGAEIFWLAEFSALYSAPFDHDFLDALAEVVGNGSLLGVAFEKTFERGTYLHDAIGRQFNSLCMHVKFFSM
jgi:hypothetical protein